MNNEFQEFWEANFQNCPPVNFTFKEKLERFWFRIHSLPESKRYAENDAEMAEILRRQRILLDDVIGTDDECFVVCGSYVPNLRTYYAESFPQLVDMLRFNSKSVPLVDFDSDGKPGEFFNIDFGKQKIVFEALREILVGIANDQIYFFFILNPITKRIFSPYDGGVDLILESEEKRSEFKAKYKDWLSTHPNGY